MTSGRSRLARWASLGGLLLLGMLVAGLLAMHGVQASGPEGMSGVPVMGMDHPGAMPGLHNADLGKQAPPSPEPGHQHPGGEVCLGLLVLAFALALLVLGFRRRTTTLLAAATRPAWERLLRAGRPPPSIYRLAVLRL